MAMHLKTFTLFCCLLASNVVLPNRQKYLKMSPEERKASIIRPYTANAFQRKFLRGVPITKMPNPVGRKGPALDTSRPLPCCKDESGGSICRTMKNHDLKGFTQKCNSEPDFSLVVCCRSCGEVGVGYRDRAQLFFLGQNNSTNCFDRMSPTYCARFEQSSDTWSNKRWSCDATHFRLGFRVCRATCGFCSMDWKNAPEPVKCN